jgi:hypothetical protein
MRWRRCCWSSSSLLAVFTAGQFALSQALTGRDEQLAELNARLSTLAEELNIAASENERLSLRVSGLETENAALTEANDTLPLKSRACAPAWRPPKTACWRRNL